MFLERCGYERARRYFFLHDGVYYDSKAIVGVAHRHVAEQPLRPDEFSGGRQTVERLLIRLGFDVVNGGTSRRFPEPDGSQDATRPGRHQPITLLWAMGRAAGRRPRLVAWRDARAALRDLLLEYGHESSQATPQFPFLALARTPLWELAGHSEDVPPVHGNPLPWLEEHNPRGGLRARAYEIIAASQGERDAAIGFLADVYFEGNLPRPLLRRVAWTSYGMSQRGRHPAPRRPI